MTESATILKVVDGDTVTVELEDGTEETVRVLGIDTPETGDNVEAERRAEWEGIGDLDYLGKWGDQASLFAKDELAGAAVELEADENEPDRGTYGRLLRYVRYTPSDGDDSVVYNRRAVAEGYARVYHSGFAHHDDYLDAELDARADQRGVWKRSDPDASPEIRDKPVGKLYVPRAASIHTETGAVDESRVPVFAESSATQQLDSGTAYDEALPLVAVDEESRVALVSGPLVDESYEEAERFSEDTSRYGNFPFVTNLLTSLTDRSGSIFVDGGHGQFNADFALSLEDMAYYLRFLEGQDVALHQVNSWTEETLAEARGIVVTAPAERLTEDERAALASFAASGGAVVLVGHAAADMPARARENLNEVAAALDTDLRLNGDTVSDEASHLADDPRLVVTSNLNSEFEHLFFPVTQEQSRDGHLAVSEIRPSVEGHEYSELVVLENTGDCPLEISNWRVEDASGKRFEFPVGTTLPVGGRVQVRTGDGEDAVVLHWDHSQGVWNDDGDTVSVVDDTGTVVAERTY
ncbi:lamin tail domain-containing protein [Haladaptatus sp. DYSN1]|uniref:lamin tail domain-containing protein n=1 Tax=unclassified Haladaptatus TaxID=2622732 RepID=UPI0024064FDD|nr:lamin tail domain-containing protein [Haladaptatus sp. DYSN1]